MATFLYNISQTLACNKQNAQVLNSPADPLENQQPSLLCVMPARLFATTSQEKYKVQDQTVAGDPQLSLDSTFCSTSVLVLTAYSMASSNNTNSISAFQHAEAVSSLEMMELCPADPP